MNIFSIPLKLFKEPENKYLRIIHDIFDELSDRLVSLYFSWRRTLIGKKHKLDNPELYEKDKVKIISNKLPEIKLENAQEEKNISTDKEREEKKFVARALKPIIQVN